VAKGALKDPCLHSSSPEAGYALF